MTLLYSLSADQLTPCTYSSPIFHLRHHCRINSWERADLHLTPTELGRNGNVSARRVEMTVAENSSTSILCGWFCARRARSIVESLVLPVRPFNAAVSGMNEV